MVELSAKAFAGKNVLVTGGMGFIGSNLAIKLANMGAKVTILDSMLPDSGANEFNIYPVRDQVHVNYCDIRDINAVEYLVRNKDFVFHMAGQGCHVISLVNPFPDIEINITGTAVIMEALKKHNRNAIVVYAGTRGQYGPSLSLPANEEAPTNPKGIYEISNLTAEKIIKVYNDVHGIRSVLLRLTNIYGSRSQMMHSRFGVFNWFIRLALDNQTIQVYGDGSVLRDFVYIDDCVDAILRTSIEPKCYGEIFNVGSDIPVSFLEMVKKIVETAGSGNWKFAEYSPERKALEQGDFYSDITKIRRTIGWEPTTSLEDGIKQTLEYYRKHRDQYWTLEEKKDKVAAAATK